MNSWSEGTRCIPNGSSMEGSFIILFLLFLEFELLKSIQDIINVKSYIRKLSFYIANN